MPRPMVELFKHGENMHVYVQPPSEIKNVTQHLEHRFDTFVHPVLGDVSASGDLLAIENHLGQMAIIIGIKVLELAPVSEISL